MAKLTQRDIVDTIVGLRASAEDLRTLTRGTPVEGMTPTMVMAKVSDLQAMAQYLTTIADELLALIPDKEIPNLPKD